MTKKQLKEIQARRARGASMAETARAVGMREAELIELYAYDKAVRDAVEAGDKELKDLLKSKLKELADGATRYEDVYNGKGELIAHKEKKLPPNYRALRKLEELERIETARAEKTAADTLLDELRAEENLHGTI